MLSSYSWIELGGHVLILIRCACRVWCSPVYRWIELGGFASVRYLVCVLGALRPSWFELGGFASVKFLVCVLCWCSPVIAGLSSVAPLGSFFVRVLCSGALRQLWLDRDRRQRLCILFFFVCPVSSFALGLGFGSFCPFFLLRFHTPSHIFQRRR